MKNKFQTHALYFILALSIISCTLTGCTDHIKNDTLIVDKVEGTRIPSLKFRVWLRCEASDIYFYTNDVYIPGDTLKKCH
jgi:hypothetical protein